MKDSVKMTGATVAIAAGIVAIAGIFVLILVFSGSGDVASGDVAGDVTYNGFVFRETDGVWSTQWQDGDQLYKIYFRHHPEQVENVPVQGSIDRRFQNATIYLTLDLSENETAENSYLALAGIEISSKLTEPLKRKVTSACTENLSVCEGRPVVTCSDSNYAVIYLKQDSEAGVVLDGNCITVHGSGEGIVMAADNLMFRFLKIIN